MSHSSKAVYDQFRTSMLSKTDDGKNLLADDVALTGPLAQVKGKGAFIEVNTPFFASIVDSTLFELIEKDDYILTQISTTVMVPSGKTISLEVSE